MRWFIETTGGEIVQTRDVEGVAYDHENNEVELTLSSGAKASVDQVEWDTVKGLYSNVPASPGIRVLNAAPHREKIEFGPTVIAWRIGGGGFPIGVSVDCAAEITATPDYIAYLYPDGHVEDCDGFWPTLDAFKRRFNERRERWLAAKTKADR